MKKLTLLIVIAFAVSISSCRKDMTCSCESTTITTGPSGTTTTVTKDTKTLTHVKKSEGRVNCMSLKYEFEYTLSNDTYIDNIERKCTLS